MRESKPRRAFKLGGYLGGGDWLRFITVNMRNAPAYAVATQMH
jgi:hypothetical protein